MKTTLPFRDRVRAADLADMVSNWTRPKPLDFQFLRSVMISVAKTEPLPIRESKKSNRSLAMAV